MTQKLAQKIQAYLYRLQFWVALKKPYKILSVPAAFDTKWYLKRYPDIANNNIDPFYHYLSSGWKEKRNPNPYFDIKWYFKNYPEAKKSGIEPLTHYLSIGWKKGFDPGPNFCGKDYLDRYPDVQTNNLEPLSHYLQYGMNEAREASYRRSYIDEDGALQTKILSKYEIWKEQNNLSGEDIEIQKKLSKKFLLQPLFSFLTPVYNPDPDVFIKMINSIISQTYENWEICFANGGDSQQIKFIITEFQKNDKRIKCLTLEKNLGISGNSNQSLSIVEGDFSVFMDHDDTISPDMLFEIAAQINETPDIDLIYFDEDKVTEIDRYCQPLFKPNKFSLETFLSANILTHCVVRTNLLKEVNGFDPQKDGAQDWDIFLKVIEKTDRIVHVPKVLYHWRISEKSAASSITSKPYALLAQNASLKEHCSRMNKKCLQINSCEKNWTHQFVWEFIPEPISILLINHDNSITQTANWIKAFHKSIDYDLAEYIIIVDAHSQSQTNTYDYSLQNINGPQMKILPYDEDIFTYAHAANLAAQNCESKYLLFIEKSIETIDTNFFKEILQWGQQPGIGIVGPKILKTNHKLKNYGKTIDKDFNIKPLYEDQAENFNGIFGSTTWYRNYTIIDGDCLLLSKEVYTAVNGFNEKYLTKDYAILDFFCKTIKNGHRILCNPFAQIRQTTSSLESSKTKIEMDKRQIKKDHHDLLQNGDPYFNSNLVLVNSIPEIKFDDGENSFSFPGY